MKNQTTNEKPTRTFAESIALGLYRREVKHREEQEKREEEERKSQEDAKAYKEARVEINEMLEELSSSISDATDGDQSISNELPSKCPRLRFHVYVASETRDEETALFRLNPSPRGYPVRFEYTHREEQECKDLSSLRAAIQKRLESGEALQ